MTISILVSVAIFAGSQAIGHTPQLTQLLSLNMAPTRALYHHINTYQYGTDGNDVFVGTIPNRTGQLAAVGKLIGPRGECSGTVFKDKRIVLTSGHCIYGSTPDPSELVNMDDSVDFMPGMVDGVPLDTIKGKVVRIGHNNFRANPDKDYAIVVLSRPAPVIPMQPDLNLQLPTNNLVFAGYPESPYDGKSLSIVAGCRGITGGAGLGLISNYCNVRPGGSGGFLGTARILRNSQGAIQKVDDLKIVGIVKGAGSDDNRYNVPLLPENQNVAVPIKNVINGVNAEIIKLEHMN